LSKQLKLFLINFMKLKIGESIVEERIVTQDQINEFAKMSRDEQAIHTDTLKSQSTIFGSTIVHGMFTMQPISYFLGKLIPEDNEYLLIKNINIDFLAPVYPLEKIKLVFTLLEHIKADNWRFEAKWFKENNSLCAQAQVVAKRLEYGKK